MCAGALERFVGDAQERDALVAAVARECERAAQMDWAVELYLYAGAARPALSLINQQLSNALQPALTDPRKGGRTPKPSPCTVKPHRLTVLISTSLL